MLLGWIRLRKTSKLVNKALPPPPPLDVRVSAGQAGHADTRVAREYFSSTEKNTFQNCERILLLLRGYGLPSGPPLAFPLSGSPPSAGRTANAQ